MVDFDSPTLLQSIRLPHSGNNERFFGRLRQQFQTKNSRAGVHDVRSLERRDDAKHDGDDYSFQ